MPVSTPSTPSSGRKFFGIPTPMTPTFGRKSGGKSAPTSTNFSPTEVRSTIGLGTQRLDRESGGKHSQTAESIGRQTPNNLPLSPPPQSPTQDTSKSSGKTPHSQGNIDSQVNSVDTTGNVLHFTPADPSCRTNGGIVERLKPPDRVQQGQGGFTGANIIRKSTSSSSNEGSMASLNSPAGPAGSQSTAAPTEGPTVERRGAAAGGQSAAENNRRRMEGRTSPLDSLHRVKTCVNTPSADSSDKNKASSQEAGFNMSTESEPAFQSIPSPVPVNVGTSKVAGITTLRTSGGMLDSLSSSRSPERSRSKAALAGLNSRSGSGFHANSNDWEGVMEGGIESEAQTSFSPSSHVLCTDRSGLEPDHRGVMQESRSDSPWVHRSQGASPAAMPLSKSWCSGQSSPNPVKSRREVRSPTSSLPRESPVTSPLLWRRGSPAPNSACKSPTAGIENNASTSLIAHRGPGALSTQHQNNITMGVRTHGRTPRRLPQTPRDSPKSSPSPNSQMRNKSKSGRSPSPQKVKGDKKSQSCNSSTGDNSVPQSPALKRRFLSVKERTQAFLNKAGSLSSNSKTKTMSHASRSEVDAARDGLNLQKQQDCRRSESGTASAAGPCLTEGGGAASVHCSEVCNSSSANHIIGSADNGLGCSTVEVSGELEVACRPRAWIGARGCTTTVPVNSDTCVRPGVASADSQSTASSDSVSTSCHSVQSNHSNLTLTQRLGPSVETLSPALNTNTGLYQVVDITSPQSNNKSSHSINLDLHQLEKFGHLPLREASKQEWFNCEDSSSFDGGEFSHVHSMEEDEVDGCIQGKAAGDSCVTEQGHRASGHDGAQGITNMEVIYDEPYMEVEGEDLVEGHCRHCGDLVAGNPADHSCEYENCAGHSHPRRDAKGPKHPRPRSGGDRFGFNSAAGAQHSTCRDMHSHSHAGHAAHAKRSKSSGASAHGSHRGANLGLNVHHQHIRMEGKGTSSSMESMDSRSSGSTKLTEITGVHSAGSTVNSEHGSTSEMHLSHGISPSDMQHPSPMDTIQLKHLHQHHKNLGHSREFVRQISAPAMIGSQRPSFNSPSCGIRMAEMRAASKRHNSSPYYFTLDPEYMSCSMNNSPGSAKTSPVYCEIAAIERSPPTPHEGGCLDSSGASYESLHYSSEVFDSARSQQNERPPLPPRDYRLSDEYKPLSVQTVQQQAWLGSSAASSRHNTPSPNRHSSPSPQRPYPNLGLIHARRASHDSNLYGVQHHQQHYTPLMMSQHTGAAMGFMHSGSPSPAGGVGAGSDGSSTCSDVIMGHGAHGAAAAAVAGLLNHSPLPGGVFVPPGGAAGAGVRLIASPDSGNGTGNSANLSMECSVQAGSDDMGSRSLTDPSSENASPRHSLLSQSDSQHEVSTDFSPPSTMGKCDAASQTDKSTLLRQARKHSAGKSKLRQPGMMSPSSSMSSSSGAIRKTLDNAQRLLSPSPNRGREIERSPLVCRLPKRHNHVNGQCSSLCSVGSKSATNSPTRSKTYPSVQIPHPAISSPRTIHRSGIPTASGIPTPSSGATGIPTHGGTHQGMATPTGGTHQGMATPTGIPVPKSSSPHRSTHSGASHGASNKSKSKSSTGRTSPKSKLVGMHGMKASERHLYRYVHSSNGNVKRSHQFLLTDRFTTTAWPWLWNFLLKFALDLNMISIEWWSTVNAD